jgi:hypothetical protein
VHLYLEADGVGTDRDIGDVSANPSFVNAVKEIGTKSGEKQLFTLGCSSYLISETHMTLTRDKTARVSSTPNFVYLALTKQRSEVKM